MDKRIAELFEYQHFAPNKRMEKIIADTQRRYEALDEEELFLVAAAGEIFSIWKMICQVRKRTNLFSQRRICERKGEITDGK